MELLVVQVGLLSQMSLGKQLSGPGLRTCTLNLCIHAIYTHDSFSVTPLGVGVLVFHLSLCLMADSG